MQILIALCSNVLETVPVVVSGGPLGFYHIWWKLKSIYDTCAHTCGKMRVC